MDFNLYLDAVKTLFSGVNPYLHLTNYPGPYNYPPTSFLFLIFFQNKLLFNFCSFLAFFISIFLLTKKRFFLSVFLFLLFTFFYFPLKFNYGMGQINNFILLFIVLAYYYNPFFLAYAIGIKLVPAIYLFYYIIKKDYKKITLVLFFLFLLFTFSFLLLPWDFQKVYFFDVFWRAFGSGGKEVYYNQSLAGFLSRSNLDFLLYPFSFLLLFMTWLKGRKLNKDKLFSAVTCLMLMLNPIAWQHHFVIAIIPLVLLVKLDKLATIVAYLLLAWNFRRPEQVPVDLNIILSHQFLGTFILWILALFGKNALRVLGAIGVIGIIGIYLRFLLCRGSFCF